MEVTPRAGAWKSGLVDRIRSWTDDSLKQAATLHPALASVPTVHEVVAIYEPEQHELRLVGERAALPWELHETKLAAERALGDTIRVSRVPVWRVGNQPWIKIASTNTLRRVGETLNFFPGTYPGGIPNHPGPLGAAIASGLVGAATGYGAGWLGEKLLPGDWRRGRLRKTLAALGAGAGLAAPLAWSYANHANGKSITDPWPLNTPPASELYKTASELVEDVELDPDFATAAEKLAGPIEGAGAGDPSLAIDVDEFHRAIWLDGRVGNRLNPQTRGAITGALAAASGLPGGVGPGFVTPLQMGQLAAGMGTGYVSGAIVGSALGALTGMPPGVQERLKQTGMYAGLVSQIVPRLFGG